MESLVEAAAVNHVPEFEPSMGQKVSNKSDEKSSMIRLPVRFTPVETVSRLIEAA